MRSVKRMDSPESRRFWKQLDKNREEVEGWPEWKRQTPVADPPLPRSPLEALVCAMDWAVTKEASSNDPRKC